MAEVVNQSFRHESNVAIQYVRIIQGDAGLDVTQLFHHIVLQEDIEKGFIQGEIVMLDSFLSSSDVFMGSEIIELSFSTADENFQMFDPYVKRFRITRYESNLQADTGTVRALKFYFVSEPAVNNDRIKLMRSYTNMSNSSFVDHVCDVIGVTESRFIEETLHSKNFVAPNVSPLDMINWIKTTSQSKVNNGADFYFFENKEGVHFKCIDTMKAVEPKHLLVYKPVIDNFTYNIITTLEKPKGFDIQDDYRHGGIGCTVYTHDLVTKQYNKHTIDPRSLPLMNPVDPRGDNYEISPSAFSQFWPHNGPYGTMDVNSTNHSALIRSVNKTLINFKDINVEIAGNVDIKSGDVVDVIIPGFDGAARIDESGKWIVKKLRHLITNGGVITQLELISDSNIQSVETQVESENVEEK